MHASSIEAGAAVQRTTPGTDERTAQGTPSFQGRLDPTAWDWDDDTEITEVRGRIDVERHGADHEDVPAIGWVS